MAAVLFNQTGCLVPSDTSNECIYSVQQCSDCNCDQSASLARICMFSFLPINTLQLIASNYLETTFLVAGLIANVILLLVLTRPAFCKAITFLYVRLIALIGLLLIVVQLAKKLTTIANSQTSPYYYGVLLTGLYVYISDSVQLLVSTFSVFLCFDRLIGVVKPTSYSKINNRKFLSVAFCLSALIGGLGMIGSVHTEVLSYNSTTYYLNPFNGNDQLNLIIEKVVLVVRLVQVALLIIFAAVIMIKMHSRTRRLRKAMTKDVVEMEQKKMRNLCTFQFLETTEAVLHLLLFCIGVFAEDLLHHTELPLPFTFGQYVTFNNVLRIFYVFGIIKEATLYLSHFPLLFLYLIFSKMFRNEFLIMLTFPCRRGEAVFLALRGARGGNFKKAPAAKDDIRSEVFITKTDKKVANGGDTLSGRSRS